MALAVCLSLGCTARRPDAQPPLVEQGWLRIGRLALPWPPDWVLLPGAAAASPAQPDPDCDCSRLGLGFTQETPHAVEKRLARIWTGADTLVLDTVQVMLWPGDCFEPCRQDFYQLEKAAAFEGLFARFDSLQAHIADQPIFHRVLPAIDTRILAGHTLTHINGQYHEAGRSGLYFPGHTGQRPLNLYGRHLAPSTIEALRGMVMGAQWM